MVATTRPTTNNAAWTEATTTSDGPRCAGAKLSVSATPRGACISPRPRRVKRTLPRRSGARAEARQLRRKLGQSRELRLRVQLLRTIVEDRLRLRDVGIRDAAVDGAHGCAGFLLVKADALGAEHRIDDEDVLALADGAIRALRLAGAAVDAFLGDHRRHVRQSLQLRLRFQSSDRHRQRNVAAGSTQPHPESVSGRERPGSTVEYDSYAALRDEIQLEGGDGLSGREH